MSDARERGAAGWVLAAAIIASSMAFIDQSAVSVMLAVVQRALDASAAEMLWFVNGYLLMLASLILVGGALGDRLGKGRLFGGGIALFTAGSVACSLSPSALALIAARILQGIGGAFMIPGSLSLIVAAFDPARRGRAIGTWSAATTIAAIAGPVLGGLLAGAGLWRVVFLLNLPLGLLSFWMVRRRVPAELRLHGVGPTPAGGAGVDAREPPLPRRRIDLLGVLFAATGLGAVSYGLISAPSLGLGSLRIVGALGVGGIALAAFLVVEARGAAPLLPLRLFRNRVFAGANLLTLFLYAALAVFSLFLPLTMVEGYGFSPAEAGMAMLPFALLLAGLSRGVGRIAERVGVLPFLIVGPSLVAGGFLLLSVTVVPGAVVSYWEGYLPGILLLGVGMGATVVPLTTAVMTSLDHALSGTASGVNNAVSRIAGVLGIAVFGAVAISSFAGDLHRNVLRLDLTPAQLHALDGELSRLGAARVPSAIPPPAAAAVRASLQAALGETFRVILRGCAGLALASAVAAALFLRRPDYRGREVPSRPGRS